MHKNKITTAAIMMILSSAILTPVMAEEVQNQENNATQIEQSADQINASNEDTNTTPDPTQDNMTKNAKPTIELTSKTILINIEGAKDLDIVNKVGAKAIDKEDGELSINVIGYDSSKVGEQTVTLEAKDSHGHIVNETVTIKIIDIKDEITTSMSDLKNIDPTTLVEGIGENDKVNILKHNQIDGNKCNLIIEVIDQYGNRVEGNVNVISTENMEHAKPTIELTSKTILINIESAKELDIVNKVGAKAIDKEDGELSINVIGYDSSKVGEQTVTLEAKDSHGHIVNETVTIKIIDIKYEITTSMSDLKNIDPTTLVEGIGENDKVNILKHNHTEDHKGSLIIEVLDQYGNRVEGSVNVVSTETHVSEENSLVQGSVINAVKGESAYVKVNIKDENLNNLTSARIKTNDGKIIDLKLNADSQIIKLDPETVSFNIEYVSLDKTYITHRQTITWTEKEDTTQPSKVDTVVEELSKESGLSIDKSEDSSAFNINVSEKIGVGIVSEALDKENTSIEVNDGVLEIKIENTIIKSSKELTTIEKNASEKYEITSDGMISKYALKAPVTLKSARAFSLFSVSALAAEPQWDLVYTIDTKENTIQYANGEVKSFQPTATIKLLVDANGNIQEPVLDIIEENDGTPTDPVDDGTEDNGGTPTDPVDNEPGENDGTPTDPVDNEPGENDGTPTDPVDNEPGNNDGTTTDPIDNETVSDDNTSNPVNNEVEDNNLELPKTGANMLGSISTMILGAASILTGGVVFNRKNKK